MVGCPQWYLNNGTIANFSFSDSPRRLWWYHWICWLLSVVGIFCILLAHDHYTVDVVVAYYITTRLFWWYHTMANQQVSVSPHLILTPVALGLPSLAWQGEKCKESTDVFGFSFLKRLSAIVVLSLVMLIRQYNDIEDGILLEQESHSHCPWKILFKLCPPLA